MKFHLAAITLLGLADTAMSRYSYKNTKEQEQCTVQDELGFTQPDGSVLGCIKGTTLNNRFSNTNKKSSSKSSGIFGSYDKKTDSNTDDDCGTVRILPANEECMTGDIPLVITKPRPPPTPCTCTTSTVIRVIDELKTFADHASSAAAMGCSLATFSDEAGLAELVAAASQPYMGPSGPINVFIFGLFRPTDGELGPLGLSPTEGDPVIGPWGFLDECTPYTFNPFRNDPPFSEPNNFLGAGERLGGIFFDPPVKPGFAVGDIVDINDNGYPALYECCI